MKSLTHCEIPSIYPLHRSCSGFLIAACVSKSSSLTRLWSRKLFRKPAMNVHRKISTIESKGKTKQKIDAAYGTFFRIGKCFQKSKQKLHIHFSLKLDRQKIKIISAWTENTYLIVWALKKYSTGDIIPSRASIVRWDFYHSFKLG